MAFFNFRMFKHLNDHSPLRFPTSSSILIIYLSKKFVNTSKQESNKMDYLERTCCLCLSQEQNVTSQSDIGSKIQEMFEYIVPEHAMNTSASAVSRKICDNCSSSLNNIFEFRQRCLKSIRTYNEYLRNLLEKNESCKYSLKSSTEMLQNVKCETLEDVEQKIEEQNFHKELKIEILDTDYGSSPKEKQSEIEKMKDTIGHVQIKKELSEEMLIKEDFKEDLTLENSMQSSNAEIHNTIQQERSHNMETFENIEKQSHKDTSNNISDSLPTSQTVRTERGNNKNSGQKVYTCDTCKKSFNKFNNLKSHIRIHTGERPYVCDVCQKAFTHFSTLKEHKRIHSGERPFSCDVCSKSFAHLSSLRTHKLIHSERKLHTCDICEQSFTLIGTLKKHKLIHSGEKPYICDICKRTFRHFCSLKIHKYTHSGQRSSSTYSCDLCRKTFKYPDSLKEHKRIHSGERIHSCDVCWDAFTHSSTLRKHKLIHSDERPYTCQVCQKSFRQLGNLNTHKLIHTGEKPHPCEVCQQSFARRSTLIRHKQRIHSIQ